MTAARDIMTSAPQCIDEDQTLVDAAKAMDLLSVGALPVCGADRTLIGMLTDRDIVVRCIARNGDPATTRTGDLAQGPLVMVQVADDVDQVLKTMSRNQVRRLLVADGHDLVGIISQADVARWASPQDAGEALAEISL
ncbi:MAG TPA: CBS domain-containing protein [Microbacterium sp.]|uniref:CBS domain-containing protein n=1 Tax=Microbacterium sp. TaxID=51671 RepID=UPI002B480782|nr:CBS domain-containing protein [Microbacterium sp.]HKT56059.1 CBS domain-containing protein [Microbacterium sp.]